MYSSFVIVLAMQNFVGYLDVFYFITRVSHKKIRELLKRFILQMTLSMLVRICQTEHRSRGKVYMHLYSNQINARALIGQSAMAYCAGPVNSWKTELRVF